MVCAAAPLRPLNTLEREEESGGWVVSSTYVKPAGSLGGKAGGSRRRKKEKRHVPLPSLSFPFFFLMALMIAFEMDVSRKKGKKEGGGEIGLRYKKRKEEGKTGGNFFLLGLDWNGWREEREGKGLKQKEKREEGEECDQHVPV